MTEHLAARSRLGCEQWASGTGPTSFRSPWQNGYAERLIGSVRRECTDHLIAFNAEHLRRLLAKYAICYNEVRTHGSLGKDTPCTRPIERFGDVVARIQSLAGYIVGTLKSRWFFRSLRAFPMPALTPIDALRRGARATPTC
jgi:hypothetical protein